MYRGFICGDGSPIHLQFKVPASLQNQAVVHYHDISTVGH